MLMRYALEQLAQVPDNTRCMVGTAVGRHRVLIWVSTVTRRRQLS